MPCSWISTWSNICKKLTAVFFNFLLFVLLFDNRLVPFKNGWFGRRFSPKIASGTLDRSVTPRSVFWWYFVRSTARDFGEKSPTIDDPLYSNHAKLTLPNGLILDFVWFSRSLYFEHKLLLEWQKKEFNRFR